MKKKRSFKRNIFKYGISNCNKIVQRGTYGIIAISNCIVTKQQIECCRILMRRELKKKGKIVIRATFNIPLTKKATGVRMGKGKGPIKVYICYLRANDCFFEFTASKLKTALQIYKKLSYKLPCNIILFSQQNNKFYTMNK